ncbi:hypothetical protein ACWET9_15275, partial [Streptomyces sp. NPDC004059]
MLTMWGPGASTAPAQQTGRVPTPSPETGADPTWQTGVLTMWSPGVSTAPAQQTGGVPTPGPETGT